MHYNMLSNWALEYHILIFLFVTVTLKEPLRSPGSRRSQIHDHRQMSDLSGFARV